MLQRIKSSQLSQRAHFQDEKCSFCLDPVMQDQSFAHVNQDGKILHVVGCSLGCVQSIFQMYRKKNDDIKCPICCEKFTFLDHEKILSQEEVEKILQQISQYFLVSENEKIDELTSQLKNQFIEDFFKLELIAPKALEKNDIKTLQKLADSLIKTKAPEELYNWLFFFILSHHYNQSDWANEVWRDLRFVYSRQSPTIEPSIGQDLTKAFTAYEQFCQNSAISPRNTKIINALSTKLHAFKTQSHLIEFVKLIIGDYEQQQSTEDLITYLKNNRSLLQHLKLSHSELVKEKLLEAAIEKSDVVLVKYLLENFNFDLNFLETHQTQEQTPILTSPEIQALINKSIERKKALTSTSLFSAFILISWLYSQITKK